MQVVPTIPAGHPFLQLPPVPADPILATAEAFAADRRPARVNLGIGMYYDESGHVPLLQAVRAAEARLFAAARPWTYGAMEGDARLRALAPGLLYGDDVTEGEMALQTLGGTGALTLGAELLKATINAPVVAISTPSWPNHQAIFRRLGYDVRPYRYFRESDGGLDVEGMLADLGALPSNSVVVLHGCCHNPTGVDLNSTDWDAVGSLLVERNLIPFLDMAYLGFGDGTEADGRPARLFRSLGLTTLMALSFSKSFSLYGERVGTLIVSSPDRRVAPKVLGYGRLLARGLYSMPPSHGAQLAATILGDTALRALWQEELAVMRIRIGEMRERLARRIAAHALSRDFSHLERQRGLFSYSGLRAAEVSRLRDEYAIHAVPDGRLCVAALNGDNVERVGDAIAEIVGGSTFSR